ncbi:MAG TPA: hypothetical protein VIR62_02240 [Allosphingosinicella sp.]
MAVIGLIFPVPFRGGQQLVPQIIRARDQEQILCVTKGEADVVFKGLIAATAAVALAATPAIAAGNTANIAPAAEKVSGSKQMDSSGWIVAAFAVLAVIGGIVAATAGGGDDPVSP